VFLLVPAYLGCPGAKAVKRLCVCVCVCVLSYGKPYSSLPGVDWVEVGNVAMIGYLVAFRTPCL